MEPRGGGWPLYNLKSKQNTNKLQITQSCEILLSVAFVLIAF